MARNLIFASPLLCLCSGNSLLQLSRVVKLPLAQEDHMLFLSDDDERPTVGYATRFQSESTGRLTQQLTQNETNLGRRLWSGEDLREEEMALLKALKTSARQRATVDAQRSEKLEVQTLGLFDSGTSLVAKLMGRNFLGQVEFPFPVWKHVSLRRYKEQHPESYQDLSNYSAVAVVRNPISWLQSLRKAPYNVRRCVINSTWLTDECHFKAIQVDDFDLQNIEQWWNENTEDYTLLSTFGFKRVVVVRYEDLVLDTEGSIAKIADALDLEMPEVVEQVDDAAKEHGDSGDREEAIVKIQNKTYLELYSHASLKDACDRLNNSLQKLFGYNDCNDQLR